MAGAAYWNNAIPQGLQNKVNQKLGQHLTSQPYLNPGDYTSGRKRLDFCDVGDYVTIIKANWPQFVSTMGKQDVVLRHLDDFRTYRNLIAHNNQEEVTEVVRKNAEAAILWLQKVFDSTDLPGDLGDEQET